MFGKNGINYVFFWLFTLLTLCSTFSLDHFRNFIAAGVAAMKGFNSNLLRVTPLFSISFRDYLFIDASSHS